jgi:glycosyltransferase A (GT-A) superfamily protein (DUF2064 family)
VELVGPARFLQVCSEVAQAIFVTTVLIIGVDSPVIADNLLMPFRWIEVVIRILGLGSRCGQKFGKRRIVESEDPALPAGSDMPRHQLDAKTLRHEARGDL